MADTVRYGVLSTAQIAVNRHVEATADLLRRIYDGGARQHQIVFH